MVKVPVAHEDDTTDQVMIDYLLVIIILLYGLSAVLFYVT